MCPNPIMGTMWAWESRAISGRVVPNQVAAEGRRGIGTGVDPAAAIGGLVAEDHIPLEQGLGTDAVNPAAVARAVVPDRVVRDLRPFSLAIAGEAAAVFTAALVSRDGVVHDERRRVVAPDPAAVPSG